MFQGNHGIKALIDLRLKVADAESFLAETKENYSLWQEKASLMSRDNLDLDMLDERIRSMLNYGHSSDAVILYSDK